MKLSIVMPAYNEARTIGTIVPRVLGVDIGAMERELIIVDDGSTDGTRDVLAAFTDPRIRVLLRRGGGDSTNLLVVANVGIDRKTRSATLDGQPLDLTRREVTLLEILLSRPGRIFGKDELIDRLFTIDDNPNANTVEQYIGRLRKKMAGAQFEIRTLRGLGYQVILT